MASEDGETRTEVVDEKPPVSDFFQQMTMNLLTHEHYFALLLEMLVRAERSQVH